MADQSGSLEFIAKLEADFEAARARATVREALFGEVEDGVRFGRYLLLDQIGSGGMGVVYAAYDAELDRKVALKLVRSANDGRRNERLLREAKAMAKLSHPNVVTVYEAGTAEGEVFYAMEFVRGADLRQWLQGTKRSWREVLAVLIDAGTGLGAAHEAGIVHRDFKPENVFVGDDGRVRVGDFGLARSLDEQSSADAGFSASDSAAQRSPERLTRTGALVGTPAYLAPEAAEGKPANELCDQFSFCVTAYEALLGTRPFVGKSFEAILEAAREGRLEPASAARPVPSWLRRVIVRGLAADPAVRFRSMSALVGELRRDRARRWRRLGVAAAAVGTAGAAWVFAPADATQQCSGSEDVLADVWGAEQSEAMHEQLGQAGMDAEVIPRLTARIDDYGRRFVEVRTDACFARRVRGETTEEQFALQSACLSRRLNRLRALTQRLSRADSEIVGRAVESVAQLPSVEDCGDLGSLAQRHSLPDDPVARERLEALQAQLDEAEALRSLGQHGEFQARIDALLVEAEAFGFASFRASVMAARVQSFQSARETVDLDELYEALHVAEAAGNDEAAALVWTVLVNHYTDVGDFDESRRMAAHADALITRLAEPQRLRRSWHIVVANNYGRERRDYDAAIEHFNKAIEFTEEGSLDRARTQGNLANIHASLERNKLALSIFENAYATALDAAGANHNTSVYLHFNVARMKSRVDQIDESNAIYLDVIPKLRRLEGPKSILLGYAQNNLGQNYADQAQFDDAIRWIRTGLDTLEARSGPEHPSLVRPLRGLANTYIKMKEPDAARPVATRAVEIAKKTIGPEHPDTAYAKRRLAQVELLAGRAETARSLLEATLAAIEGSDEPEIEFAITWFDLARALWPEESERERALELVEKAHAIALRSPHEDDKEVRYRSWLEAHR